MKTSQVLYQFFYASTIVAPSLYRILLLFLPYKYLAMKLFTPLYPLVYIKVEQQFERIEQAKKKGNTKFLLVELFR